MISIKAYYSELTLDGQQDVGWLAEDSGDCFVKDLVTSVLSRQHTVSVFDDLQLLAEQFAVRQLERWRASMCVGRGGTYSS